MSSENPETTVAPGGMEDGGEGGMDGTLIALIVVVVIVAVSGLLCILCICLAASGKLPKALDKCAMSCLWKTCKDRMIEKVKEDMGLDAPMEALNKAEDAVDDAKEEAKEALDDAKDKMKNLF